MRSPEVNLASDSAVLRTRNCSNEVNWNWDTYFGKIYNTYAFQVILKWILLHVEQYIYHYYFTISFLKVKSVSTSYITYSLNTHFCFKKKSFSNHYWLNIKPEQHISMRLRQTRAERYLWVERAAAR